MCILRRSCACNRWIFPIFAYLIGGLILLQMRIRLFTIPNLLTLMNLLCGSFAVVAALMYNDLTLAFWLIVAGIVFDFSMVSWPVCCIRLRRSGCSSIRWRMSLLRDWLLPQCSGRFACRPNLAGCRRPGSSGMACSPGGVFCAASGQVQHRRNADGRILRTSDARRIASLRFARHAVAAGGGRSFFGRGVADRRADLPAPRFSDPHVRSQVPRLRLARKRGAIPLSAGEYRVDNYTSYIRYPGNYRFIYRRVGGSLALHALGKSR